MPESFKQSIAMFANQGPLSSITHIQRGIEKESLRIRPSGFLAQTGHPRNLGSALAHPQITTDYSEALLEFITPVFDDIKRSLACLDEIHRFVYSQLENEEILWVSSMPCILEGDENIPIAQYGQSNIAKMKEAYRLGLGHRYGRLMQTIAGIHYNFSLPDQFWLHWQQLQQNHDNIQDFKTAGYFGLIRNFRRYFWLIVYLFGSSPAVCKTFLRGRKHHLVPCDDMGSLCEPYATSLRMGDLGYQSDAQAKLIVCYNSLDNYVSTLSNAIKTPHPDYEKIGVQVNGEYRQLNTGLLQIENEFYSAIRPKRVAQQNETPLHALRERGVEYIEVRCIDVNPHQPLGIDEKQIYFLDTFLLYCLLKESPETNTDEYQIIANNQQKIVSQGRDPQLLLEDHFKQDSRSVKDWGTELVSEMAQVADILDLANKTRVYSDTLQEQLEKINQPNLTPSAQLLEEMQSKDLSYFKLAMHYAKQHRDYFLSRPLKTEVLDNYQTMAKASWDKQKAVEDADKISFESYLADYFSQ